MKRLTKMTHLSLLSETGKTESHAHKKTRKHAVLKTIAAILTGSAMLLAVPFAAAQTTAMTEVFSGGSPIYAGSTAATLSNNIDVTVASGTNDDGSTAGVATNNGAGTFNLGTHTITVKGLSSTGGLYENLGFLYITNNAPADFTGTITSTGKIDVSATVGSAYGAFFRNVDTGTPVNSNWADINTAGTIKFGNIDAKTTDNTSGNAGATGFVAGGLLGGTIDIGNVVAIGHQFAAGVELRGNVENGTTLNVASVNATNDSTNAAPAAKGAALGIKVWGNVAGTVNATGKLETTGIGTTEAKSVQVAGNVRNGAALTFNEIKATSGSGDATGFHVQGTSAGDITVNGPITATVTATSGGGNAYGARFDGDLAAFSAKSGITAKSGNEAYGVQTWGDITGPVTVTGKITAHGSGYDSSQTTPVIGATGGAAGFAAYGNNTGTITLGSIEAVGNWAVGAHFVNDVSDLTVVGNIKVESGQYEAHGVRAGEGLNHAHLGATIGSIDVSTSTTATGNAFGIQAGTADLVLTGNINAIGAGDDTSGIRTHGITDITLGGTGNTISISATPGGTANGAGIWTGGDTTIDLNGKNLNSTGVKVDTGDLTVTGTGTADLGTVNVGGDFTIGRGAGPVKTTVALDIVNSSLGGTNTINGDGKLAVYGDGSGLAEGVITTFNGATGAGVTAGNFMNTSTTSLFTFDSTNGQISYGGARSALFMSDGFVQAMMMHHRSTAWNAARDRMISSNGNGNRSGYFGQAPCDEVGCDPCDPLCGTGSFGNRVTKSAWVNYVGRSDQYASSFSADNWKLSSEGVQGGADLYRSQRGQFGTLFGYEKARMRNAADGVAADDYYFGVYGARALRNGFDVRGVFAYGRQEYDMDRVGADTYLYTSSFKGYTTETNLELGRRLGRGAWSLRPVVGVDVFNNNLKAATETGAGNEAVAYGKTNLTQVFFRSGTDLRYQVRNFTLNSGVYYAYDVNGQALQTVGTAAGGTALPLVGSKPGRELLTFNLGTDFQVSEHVSVFGGYQGEYVMDRDNSQVHSMGYVGAGFKW